MFTSSFRYLSFVLAFCMFHALVHAGPPSVQLMPKSTKQFILIPDLHRFDANLNRTKLGKMSGDPAVKPLIAELQKSADMFDTGITWADAKRVGDGELSFALIAGTNKKIVSAMTLQANGRGKELASLIARTEARLAKLGYQKNVQNQAGTMIVSQRNPKRPKKESREIHYFVRDEMYVSASDFRTLVAMLSRWNAADGDGLQNTTEFQQTRKTCKEHATRPPDVVVFVEPFGLAEAYEATYPEKKDEEAVIKKLRTEGFDAFRAIGATIRFGVEGRMLQARVAVYAPPPYRKSMRMIRMLNGATFAPPMFLPTDFASFSAMGFDIQNAFKHFGSFFDTFFAEGDYGTFKAIVTDMKTDPDGPMVDLEANVIGQLHPQVYYCLDVPKDLKPYREEGLLAIKVKNEKLLLAKLYRLLNGDPDVKQKLVRNKYIVWELWSDKNGKLKEKVVDNVVCVAHGCLLLASHPFVMERVLARAENNWNGQGDFQLVDKHFKKIPGTHVMRYFSRPNREYRNLYDLYKNRKLDEVSAGNPIFRMLLSQLGDTIDRSKLPDFDHLARYFGPVGIVTVNRPDGWLWTAFSLETK